MLTRFLVERHPRELVDYLRAWTGDDAPRTKDLRALHEHAWELAFAQPLSSVDLAWRAWAQEQSRRFPANEMER